MFSLDTDVIYEIRENVYYNLPTIFVFLFFFVSKVVIPISIVLFLRTKNYLGVIVNFILSILYFGITQQKAIIFYPLVVVIIYYFGFHLSNFFKFSAVVFILTFLSFFLTDELRFIYEYALIRRTFFIPAWTNLLYYDFFQMNDYLFWRDSKLTLGLFSNPYPRAVPYLIGDSIGAIDGHVNTGWLGSGIMQAGEFGVLLYSLIIAVTISFLSNLSRLNDGFFTSNMIGAVTFPSFFWLIMSSDLPSVFLTHGLLFIILFFLVLKIRKPIVV